MASRVLADDPLLEKDQHAALRRECERFISKSENTMN